MTNNPFAMPDPADQGGFLLSPAGVLVLAAGAIHAGDTTAEGKARSMRLIRAVLDAAQTNGCCRTEVLETLLCDYGIAPDRQRAAALELAGAVGSDGFLWAMRRAGIGMGPV